MSSAWVTFKEAGLFAWIILLVGLLGAASAMVTLLLVALRSRAAPWLGLVTMLLGATAAALGGVGVMYGRSVVDRILAGESVSPIQKERIHREGYREARSAAKVGLWCAHFPLVVGLTMFIRRRRPDGAPPGAPEPGAPGVSDVPGPALPGAAPAPAAPREGPGLGPLIGVAAAGVLTYGFAFAASRAPLPGRDIPVDDPVWRVLEAIEQVERAENRSGIELEVTCQNLEEALPSDPARPDPALMPTFPAAVRKCLDDRRARAAVLSPLSAVQRELEALTRSPLARRDPESLRQIEKDLAEVKSAPPVTDDPDDRPRLHAQVRTAEAEVNGRLPREVIQRIVRQNAGRFRLCYEKGLRARPTLQGRVTVRFVIGRDGAVTVASDGGSDLPDKDVVACVMRSFRGLSFPQPEGGIVTVSYPIILAPAK